MNFIKFKVVMLFPVINIIVNFINAINYEITS